jgi:uncharacterized protein with FMN-binding domain
MKRFLLIAAGTVSGIGAVLSITPPQLGSTNLGLSLDTAAVPTVGAVTQSPVAAQSSGVSTPTKSPAKPITPTTATTSATQTQSSIPTPVQTQAAIPVEPVPTVKTISGIFQGPVVNVSYGNVQVEIVVTNGKITDAKALMAPTGKNDKYTRMSLPALREQTLTAQSTTIQGVSGASYTTYGWRKSLQGAMVQAGL